MVRVEHPIATVDVALFTLRDSGLCVLLGRRARPPFAGVLALPGGFVRTEEDADTAAASLTFSGDVPNCPGMLDGPTSTISCPNLAPYRGTVTVEDPEGNSDTASFTFGPCESGGADF